MEGGFKEAQDSSILLQEDDPEIVKLMLEYLYTKEYHAGPSKQFQTHVKAYVLGDKYNILELKTYAAEKHVELIPQIGNDSITNFTESFRLLYASTVESDRLLKDMIITTTASNLKAFALHICNTCF
ncbi:hypothetical protein HYALB_00004266 [Hymenoscyphus albidus]|uniref:BTB domain-containing protein n=1 Tax=Hymenoscyphus albidus TaxID=595503 RepID=A0A9N9LLC2_9HELO|nr:hypothetical protein HYALB_00004266 [Hymenoscyphus albidus]